ncbi:hypothetical protein KKH27_08315 [bacterium]|nr:hypothetical protein [bacterium]MBU1985406.1 hypothetical protein [bacterium]
MKKAAFVIAFLLLSAACAMAGAWRTERFQVVHARVILEDSVLSDASVSEFDSVLEAERTAHGILLDLSSLKRNAEASERLRQVIGRFVEKSVMLDGDTLRPRGEWQYASPVVILADSSWLADEALGGFMKHRFYSEFVADDLDRAKRELRDLVKQVDLLQQDRMEKMFESK